MWRATLVAGRSTRRRMAAGARQFDPYLHDPDRWGVSLAQMSELLLPCLDAAGARSVAEVGAFAGDLTRVLVGWAAGRRRERVGDRPGAAGRPDRAGRELPGRSSWSARRASRRCARSRCPTRS